MANDIEKFDPSKLMDGVKDRIKATFVSLIPDEMWNAMVEKEIYIFTTGKIVPHHDYVGIGEDGKSMYKDWEERVPYLDKDILDNWGNVKQKAECSPLRQMIRDQLREKFQEDLKKWLNGAEYQSNFNEYGVPQISDAVKKILVENADTIFFGFMSSMMQSAFNNMRVNIQYGNSNGY